MHHQPGILEPIPGHGRYLEFELSGQAEPDSVRNLLTGLQPDNGLVVGLGKPLVDLLGNSVPELTPYPEFSGESIRLPATQRAAWLFFRGDDRGEIFNRSRQVESLLASCLDRVSLVDGFKYDIGRDLTGYEDGTENPVGDEARDAAIVGPDGGDLAGSSYVAVQQWIHDFSTWDRFSEDEQDNIIGRHRESNEEFDAPA